MNVLTITSDLNVLRDQTPARLEVLNTGKIASHMVVIVLNNSRDHYALQKVTDTLLIVPTNSYSLILAPLQVFRIVRRELFFQGRLQADIVVSQDCGLAGLSAWFLAKRYHKPLLLFMRSNILSAGFASQSIIHALRRLLGRFLAVRAQSIVIASEGTRASLADLSVAIADRALMIPHFMDIESYQKEPIRVDLMAKYPQFKVIMLVVAPLDKPSNVELAVTILAGVTHLYQGVGLVIVGEGPLRGKIKSYAARVGVADKVVFEDRTENISSYFKTARIFLCTSRYEDESDSIALAAAASCAIVTSKVGIAPTLIEDGVSGFLCEVDDAARFVADVVLMLRKPNICDGVRLNANLAVQKFMDSDEAAYLEFVRSAWDATVATAI